MTCTCGEAHPHVAARRVTADGAHVEVWSDGAVTAPLGLGFDGIPVARPKTAAAVERQRCVGWMFAAWASVFDRDELPKWYRACRDAVRRGGDERLARQIHRELCRPRVSVAWTVHRADRFGRPTERQARLPRMWWPGMAVVDCCTGPRRYSVVYIIPGTDTIEPYSGLDFATWAEVEAHLHTVRGARCEP